jgi:hypothetical protein
LPKGGGIKPKWVKLEVKGNITTNKVQRTIREYFEKLFSVKLERLEERN